MTNRAVAVAAAALILGVAPLAASAQTANNRESAPPPAATGPSNAPPPARAARPFVLPTPIAGGIVGVGLDFETTRLFAASGGSNIVVPDTMGAVGPNHIVEIINGNFQIFNKANGASIDDRSIVSFWTTTVGLQNPSNGRIFDPRIIYDPPTQRWYALAIDDAVAPNANTLYVGRSDTSDPTGDWDGFTIDADTVGVEEFHDYPTLGIDANGLYSCTQDFNGPGNETCYSFPKTDLTAATPVSTNMTRFEATPAGLPAVSGSWQPAVDFGASDGSPTRAVLLGGTGTALRRTSILGAQAGGATLAADVAITGDPGHAAPPDARQPNDGAGELHRIENVAPRFVANTFEVGDNLWAAHSVMGGSSNAAVRWYRINETTNTVIATGLIEDANRDFIDPSIAANAHGDVVIGYTCSGPSQAAGVCISVGTTSGNATTFQAPILQTPGAGFYFRDGGTDRNRWGDYSATVIDPSNPCSFWTFQEYVAVGGTGDVGPDENVESGLYGIRAVQLTFQQCQIDSGLLDFGDAPDTYGTLLASNGARHTQVFGVAALGAELDVESNGQPNAAATGDDTNGLVDDEDGVSLPATLLAGVPNAITVTASASGGRLDAFVDFNANGNFGDAGEKIFNNVALTAGANNLSFTVPAAAASGATYARFRISTSGGLAATGAASDGEVEDYTATILSLEAFCAAAPPPGAIVGTAGQDALIGGAGNDIIFGLAGNDDIQGGGGDDILCGNDGHDRLLGGEGDDGLAAGNGNDALFGDGGNDALFGGQGFDRLDGGAGTNFNNGGTENDFCINPNAGGGAVSCP